MSRRRYTGHKEENEAIRGLDTKAEYEKFKELVRSVQKDVLAGMNADEIFKKYEPLAAATLVSQMLDPKAAVAAAEKVLDRSRGKPTQHTENVHKLEKLSDEELTALLKSQMAETQEDDETIQ